MAPEIYKDEIFDRSVDVHSFGNMLYEVFDVFLLLLLLFLHVFLFKC